MKAEEENFGFNPAFVERVMARRALVEADRLAAMRDPVRALAQPAIPFLLRVLPDRFALFERQEARMRDKLGYVSILTDRTGDGTKKVLTLTEFRRRIEREPQQALALDDWNAGCGCFLEAAE